MQVLEHVHRIGEEERRASRFFEQRALVEPFAPLARWPRGEARDVLDGLEAARAAAGPWEAVPWTRRVQVLRQAAGLLEARKGLAEALAAPLGLLADELAPQLEEQLFRFRESLELLGERGPGDGPGVFQAHWSDQLGGLAARLAVQLAAGETTLLLSSPQLPQAAELLVLALREAGLPPGVLSLVHDDTRTSLDAALFAPLTGWVRLRGTSEAIAAVRARHGGGGFGAGLRRWSCWPVQNRTQVVLRGDDATAAAAQVAERALGRSSTLSGQLPGQVGRVVCHQRLFSRLCEELLTHLEIRADLARPVPLIEPDLFAHAKALWSLGLDEGATPVFGSEPVRTGPARAQAVQEGPAGEEEAGRRFKEPPSLAPILFTNVDPRQRLASQRRPCPVLALIRAGSDEEAAELRARLDG